jgi:hypothetical protein
MARNDNWRDSGEAEIQLTGMAPAHDLEVAVIATLPAGAYTAVVAGQNNSNRGRVDRDFPPGVKLANNISNRGVTFGRSRVLMDFVR